jgi:DHA1 family bicyclomycin/chloramphenicol resistance-like MFS transporter
LGFRFLFVAAALNITVSALLPPNPWWNIAPLFVYTAGAAIIAPSITLLLLDLFPAMRGLASSLQGFVQFALGGFNAGTIAPLLDTTLVHMALGMLAFTLVSSALWRVYLRHAAISLSSTGSLS